MERETKIIVTGDGSHSLYLPHLNETYHSSHGAITESRHIFIKAGLDHFFENHPDQPIHILEIGFGTGLNALLTWEWSRKLQQPVQFNSLEPFPLTSEIYEQLNYTEGMEAWASAAFHDMHEAEWNAVNEMGDSFSLHKVNVKLEDFSSDQHYQLVFFDAFAPSKQAELWHFEILEKTVGFMAANAVLVTYCAKGQFKRDLAALGLEVETLPGPPGKKEMVRGTNT